MQITTIHTQWLKFECEKSLHLNARQKNELIVQLFVWIVLDCEKEFLKEFHTWLLIEFRKK